MTKRILIPVLLILIFLTACMKEETLSVLDGDSQEIALREFEGAYELEDFRDFGTWILTIPAETLIGKLTLSEKMSIRIGEMEILLKKNLFNEEQYIALVPEVFEAAVINAGTVKNTYSPSNLAGREEEAISIWSFYIEKQPGENGTTLYEIEYGMYMEMKAAKHDFIYDDNNKLIRPSYIKSTEGFVYTKQMYYDGRQLSPSHDVNGAFSFLQAHADHETFLFWTNPNTIRIEGDNVVVEAPDTRERVRDFGTMGEIANNPYNVTDVTSSSKLTLEINKNLLDQDKYAPYNIFYIAIRGATECGPALETQTQGIYALDIPYTTTDNINLIRNARVVPAKPITVETVAPAVGSALETDTVNFTWEATEGIQSSGARIETGISHYIFSLKKGDGEYATETVNEKTIQKTLDYASDYTWQVEAIGNNSNVTDLSPEATFSIKYRVRDLGDGNYTLFDAFDEYSLGFSKADLPAAFQSGEEFRIKLNGEYLLFEEIAEGMYRMTIPYEDGVPSAEDVKDAIFEIHKAFRLVQDGVSTGYDTLVEAINAVPREGSGKIYIASESTITHTTYFWIQQKELTIQPEAGFGPIIFDGEDTHNQFSLYASASVTFIDLVMVNGLGSGDDGGAIDNQSSNLFVYNCEFRNNTSSQGGGAIRGGGINNDPQYIRHLVVENSTITNNHADDSGGGISCRYMQVEIRDTLIASNTVTQEYTNYGGGLYLFSGNATLSNVDMLNNSGATGGAMYVYMYDEGNSLTITECLLDSNYGTSGAGAISFAGSSTPFELANTTISNNTCGNNVGGMSLYHADITTNGNRWTGLIRDDDYTFHAVNDNCSVASDGTFNTVYNESDSVLFKDNEQEPSTSSQLKYRLEEL